MTELVIIGHSMGGLVARSACHYAAQARNEWLRRLDKIIFIGTPHHGAPLERGGNWVDVLLGASRVLRAAGAAGEDPQRGNH